MTPRTSLSQCLSLVSRITPEQLPVLTQDLPADLIQHALASTGAASLRHRRLPAEQIVWLVVGMVMFRRLNIVQVVAQLGLALPKPKSRCPVVPSAIHNRLRKDTKARELKRLGPGDELVELQVSKAARRKHPELPPSGPLFSPGSTVAQAT